MNDTALVRVLDAIAASRSAHFHGPVSDDAIARAEAALGLRFPPTYLAFVARLGCGSVHREEFYGLVGENIHEPSVPNAVWATLTERELGGLPGHLLVVGATGDGGLIAIDTSRRDTEGEHPVVEWWNHCPSDVLDRFADFGSFLRSVVEHDQ